MGVNLRNLLVRREVSVAELAGRTIAFDAYNTLFQFLSSIRAPDGQLLTNSKGAVTSHLIGLFSRVSKLLEEGVRPVFVFDGEHPKLKHVEIARRAQVKSQAQEKYEAALSVGDEGEMRKYAARTTRLTQEMVESAKVLLRLLGVPVVQAPSEGEAQAAHVVKQGKAWAVASQDYDSLLYATPLLVRNLSIAGKRKRPGTRQMITVRPEIIDLAKTLESLGIVQEQLIWLGMLVGTDYNPGGIKGIGPKKALKMVKEFSDPAALFEAAGWDVHCDVRWQDVRECFTALPVIDAPQIALGKIDVAGLRAFLVGENNFSEERVDRTVERLVKQGGSKEQRSLNQFFA